MLVGTVIQNRGLVLHANQFSGGVFRDGIQKFIKKILTRKIWKYKRYSCIFVYSITIKTNQNEKNHFQRMDIHIIGIGVYPILLPINKFFG
jgi:hypothetical protein